jgi:hypothetical protein
VRFSNSSAVRFYRNVFSHVPNGKMAEIARMVKAIHAQEDRRTAESKAKETIGVPRAITEDPSASEIELARLEVAA